MKERQVSNYLPPNWWHRLTKDELKQEELIQEWKHPQNKDICGLLAYYSLLMAAHEDALAIDKEQRVGELAGTEEPQEVDTSPLSAYQKHVLESLVDSNQTQLTKQLNVSPERVSKIVSDLRSDLAQEDFHNP